MREPFTLSWRLDARILEFALTGLWTEDDAVIWRIAFRAAVDDVPAGAPWFVLADLTNYPPQLPSVQDVHEDCIRYAASHGVTKAINVMSKVVTEMQMRRLTGQADVATMEFCATRAEAMTVIDASRR